jgi:hypothetical protein
MTTATKDAKVTISTPGGPEVETTVGELGELGNKIRRREVGINVQLAKREDILTAIRNASREIARAKQDWKTAKEMEAEIVEGMDEWLDVEQTKDSLKMKREALKTAMLASDEVQDATERVADKKAVLDLQRQIRSDLLVIYAAKFNTRTAESIEPGENRIIILKASVGKVEPEQLGLF